jgi:hypothetical protein
VRQPLGWWFRVGLAAAAACWGCSRSAAPGARGAVAPGARGAVAPAARWVPGREVVGATGTAAPWVPGGAADDEMQRVSGESAGEPDQGVRIEVAPGGGDGVRTYANRRPRHDESPATAVDAGQRAATIDDAAAARGVAAYEASGPGGPGQPDAGPIDAGAARGNAGARRGEAGRSPPAVDGG